MAIHVEFYGVARLRAGCTTFDVEVEESIPLANLLAALANRFPDLAGECFDCADSGYRLKSAYTVNCNGHFVRDKNHVIGNGDEVLLLAADAGG